MDHDRHEGRDLITPITCVDGRRVAALDPKKERDAPSFRDRVEATALSERGDRRISSKWTFARARSSEARALNRRASRANRQLFVR
jgi:hypothetical protein